MSFFSWRRKSLNISEEDPAYKVRYLGNIHTCMMKGDGCVDKPASILWNNYLQSSHQALDMKIVVSVSGIKAYTKEQGLMQYWSHKISYIIAHPQYPKMFLWVYRHEGRKMKLDLRCHAVLCKSEAKAKLLDVQLHEKLSFALKEFVRDKRRKHNSRLIFEKTNSELTNGSILPLRQQMLSQGGKFKPPVSKMNSAPKLGSIFELDEKEEERKIDFDLVEEEEEEEEEVEEKQVVNSNADPKNDIKEVECEDEEEEGLGGMNDSIDDEDDDGNEADDDFCTESDVNEVIDSLALDSESENVSVSSDHVCQTDGLKQDDIAFLLSKQKKTDSDGESSESGFSDSSKEIGLYRVDDGDRLNEERDVSLGPNDCRLAQCDKVTDCHNDNSFDGDNEDDGFGRSSSSIDSNSSGDSISNTSGNMISNNHSSNINNKLTRKNPLDSSRKQHLHLESTTTTLQNINENNNKITNQSSKNNDKNNNSNSFITESLNTSASSTSTSELSSSSPSSSSLSSIVSSPLSCLNSSTTSPSSSLPSPIVSFSTTESAKMVQYL